MTVFFWDTLNEDFNKGCRNSFFTKGSGISVGSFDGIHKGHRLLIESLTSKCRELNILSGIISFVRPLPSIKNNSMYPGDVSTLNQRLKIFEQLNVDFVILVDFTPDFASLSGIDFFTRLIQICNMKAIAEGIDFRCGYKGQTDSSIIKAFCNENSIDCTFVNPVFFEKNGTKQRISSSLLRAMICEGEVYTASQLLNREYELELPQKKLNFTKDDFVQVLPGNGQYDCINEKNQKVKLCVQEDRITIDRESSLLIFH